MAPAFQDQPILFDLVLKGVVTLYSLPSHRPAESPGSLPRKSLQSVLDLPELGVPTVVLTQVHIASLTLVQSGAAPASPASPASATSSVGPQLGQATLQAARVLAPWHTDAMRQGG